MFIEVTPGLRALVARKWNLTLEMTDEDVRKLVSDKLSSGELSGDEFAKVCPTMRKDGSRLLQTKLFGGGGGGTSAPSGERKVGLHVKSGQPVENPFTGRPAELPSKQDHLKAGVLFRKLALRSGIAIRPLDSDEQRVWETMQEQDRWCGNENGSDTDDSGWCKSVAPGTVKALLSDNTSGGLSIVPEWFDENIVTFPLLNGELFPFIDLVEMPTSHLIQTASIGNPTVIWGTAEGTGVSLFSTAALIAAITGTVFPVTCAIEIGKDHLSDAAVDVGAYLLQNVGQRMSAELDKVIAVGDGTTQPQGIQSASGIAAVPNDNGVGGPPTVGDYESLMFAIGKNYRTAGWNPSFIANDVSYRRGRSINIGPYDARKVFGMDYQSYQMMDYPYRIAPDLSNSKILFGCLKKYRLWRRQGFSIQWTSEGQTLVLKNTVILVVRGRFAGKVVDANAFAMCSTAQS